jgi:AcrR family transcriptional regulator
VVPTAFYRHFDSVEQLGVALVEEAMRTLRRVLRDARRTSPQNGNSDLISGSISVLASQVDAYAPYFRFLVNERFGGVAPVRRAIESELRLVVSDLTTDLARMPVLREWAIDDLEMAADLMVNAMLAVVPALLDEATRRERADILVRAENQLRLIALGMGVAGTSDVVRRTEVTPAVVAQSAGRPVMPSAAARPPRRPARRGPRPSG